MERFKQRLDQFRQVQSKKQPLPAANSVWPQGSPGTRNTLSSTTAKSSAATALSTRRVQGIRCSEAGTNWNRQTSRHSRQDRQHYPGQGMAQAPRRSPKPRKARTP